MNFLPHALSHTIEQRGAAAQDDILEQVFADIRVALLNGVVTVLVDSLEVLVLLAGLRRVEHDLGGAEALVADEDLAAVRELVVLLAGVGLFGLLERALVVVDHVAHFFFDVAHDLELGLGRERVAARVENFLEVVGDVAAGQVDSLDGVRDGVALVDGHGVRHPVA